ncbi:MAG: Asp-tRNA(Asn)/Glu-tRNA(Gln) amidotransferase subunit GatA [Erysipelothrix sp.]|nr:Asp-tRNA(Asn)/Glu-tRNA(Gln) amidotransferase subunit GatA [Erysipelothrix sp.]
MMNYDEIMKRLRDSQHDLNAVVTFYEDVVLQAEQAKNKVLKGMPIVLKDNVSTKGVKTTASCKLLNNYVPVFNATIVDKLQESGAVILAKTAMDELAMGGTGLTAYTGPTKNPYDATRISGGSSSGSAALVGAHLVDVAIGSDTGDSVRKPASYCGVVGFKPTYGRISRYGVVAYASSLDHVGIFSNTVAQSAELLSVLQGRDDKDLTSLMSPVEDLSDLSLDLKGKTIGIIKEIQEAKSDNALKLQFNDFLKQLEAQGAMIKEVSLDRQLLEQMYAVYYIVANCEATANHASLDGIRFGERVNADSYQEIMTKTRTQGFGELLKRRFVIGAYGLDDVHQEEVFQKAQKIRRLIVEAYDKALSEVDIVLTLASDTVAPKATELKNHQSLDEMISENHLVLDNFAGYPSITIPLGFDEGLPFGINLAARKLEDKKVLAFASAFEKLIAFSELEKGVNPWIMK